MHVLLFLTALLSALTGVTSDARASESRLARAEGRVSAAAPVAAAAAIAAERPSQGRLRSARAPGRSELSYLAPPRPAPLATVKLLE